MRHETQLSTSGVEFDKIEELPSVFAFSDYRTYLKAYFEAKKKIHPKYSASFFTRRAGLGANSRGYLKLVVEGRRNLSPATIRSFSEALGHKPQESLYFENLVLFNQAERPSDKKYYFERLVATLHEKTYSPLVLLQQQHAYYSNWYYVVIRELVALDDFVEDYLWISHHLLGAVKKEEIRKAISDLLVLGLIERDSGGRLRQSKPLIKAPSHGFEHVLKGFHLQMLDRVKAALDDERVPAEVLGLTLSCCEEDFSLLLEDLKKMRSELNAKYGQRVRGMDCVLHLGIQLAQMTKRLKPKKGERV